MSLKIKKTKNNELKKKKGQYKKESIVPFSFLDTI